VLQVLIVVVRIPSLLMRVVRRRYGRTSAQPPATHHTRHIRRLAPFSGLGSINVLCSQAFGAKQYKLVGDWLQVRVRVCCVLS
jgi:hypothetical protein